MNHLYRLVFGTGWSARVGCIVTVLFLGIAALVETYASHRLPRR